MKENILFPVISDFSEFPGSRLYCSEETAGRIRKEISAIPLHAIHLLGTGDWHYVSLFWLERIDRPFTLVLFDNHPDDQPCAFGEELLSCGSWVRDAVKLPFCKGVLWNPESATTDDEVYISIDLDVLSPEYARTNWDQGGMTIPDLLGRLREFRRRCGIIGVDICGGLPDDSRVNAEAENAISGIFSCTCQESSL